jgi:hypothetical protein
MTAYSGSLPPVTTEPLNNDAAFVMFFDTTETLNRYTNPLATDYSVNPESNDWDNERGALSGSWVRGQTPLNSHANSGTQSGKILRDFFYDVLHILPIPYTGEFTPRVNVGSITKTTVSDQQLWNAFLTSTTISATTYTQSGVEIDTTGITLFPNQLRTFDLTTEGVGASRINCDVTFETNNGDWSFTVVGLRTYAPPIWALVPVKETIKVKTWTFTSENGKEQRMDLRAIPRRDVSFESFLNILQWLSMQNIIKARRNNSAAIPIFHEASFTGAEYQTGDTVLAVETDNAEYYVGGYVGVMDGSNGNTHFSVIESLTAASVTMGMPLEADFYDVRIFPMMVGYFTGAIADKALPYIQGLDFARSHTLANHKVGFQFQTTDGDDIRGYVSPYTLDGLNIIEWLPENQGADRHDIKMWDVDFDYGRIVTGTSEPSSRIGRSFKVTLNGKSEIWDFRRFVHTHTNRTPFWFTTNLYSLLLAENVEIGATAISVYDLGFYDTSIYRTALAIKHPDGTVNYRLIDSMTSDGTVTVISLDSALTNSAELASVNTKVSFLILGRIDGDVSLEHFGHKSIATFRVTEVYQ